MARVAAIDCGTNSIRLLVADVHTEGDGTTRLTDVHREMRIVRLGQGVDATGRLAREAVNRTQAALTDYAETVHGTGAERVRMVATSATRDAANREEFFAMTREVLGVEAEVITGDEEAALSFAGAAADLPPERGPFVVTDVGGGSTEVVLGDWDGATAHVHAARSVDIGCVRLTERCLHSDPPTDEEVVEATRLAGQVLADAFDAVDVSGAATWIGVAGTVTTLSALAQGLDDYDPERTHLSTMTRAEIAAVTQRLLRSSHAERAELAVIHPGRRDVITGGAL
ncbi:MAG: exopolyphosphatase, partial [Sciscionella sp.]